MKDKRTHLAHKSEHVVDMDTQAIIAVNLGDANEGDTSSNGPSPTRMTPALCDACTCAVEATSSSAC